MIEAARTTASPAVIWTIVVIMSLCTAFLVAATSVADVVQNRQSRRQRMLRLGPGPVRSGALGAGERAPAAATGPGAPAAAGLPPQRTSHETPTGQGRPQRPAPVPQGMASAGSQRMGPANPVPNQRQDAARQAGGPATQPAGRAPAQPNDPAQPSMPAQRSGESDRAERSLAGPGSADPNETGQPKPRRRRRFPLLSRSGT